MKILYKEESNIYIHLKNGKIISGKEQLLKEYYYNEIPISKKYIFSGTITLEKLLNEIHFYKPKLIHKTFFKRRKYLDCYSYFNERIYEDTIDFFEIEHNYKEVKYITIDKLRRELDYKEYFEFIEKLSTLSRKDYL